MTRYSLHSSRIDYPFLICVVVLVLFGFVMLASASSDLAWQRFGDSYYYIKHQFVYGFLIGAAGFLLGFFVPFQFWERWSLWLLLCTIVLLSLVFTPLGFGAYGSERWLHIFGVSFQPGEIAKFTFITYLASWIARSHARRQSVMYGFFPFLILTGLVTFLLVLQPATSIAVILVASVVAMYFTAGARVKFVAAIILVGMLGVALLTAITPYRLQRFKVYFNPSSDELGSGYHINQSLIAVGSGGLFGVGYGRSTTKIHYLPEPIGDSIFAVIAEELGFVGSLSFLTIFSFLLWRGIYIARRTKDTFGRLFVIGVISLFCFQAFVNIGAVTGVIPFTGVPLPFISYGGTALAIFLTMCGIVLNVSKRR